MKKDFNYYHEQLQKYNLISASDKEARFNFLKNILGSIGENTTIKQPFLIDIPTNLHIGKNCFINYNCTILNTKESEIIIGNNVAISSGVSIVAVSHPGNPLTLKKWTDIPYKISIDDNVWIGANVTIAGNVHIGKNVIIGMGATITKDCQEGLVYINRNEVLCTVEEYKKKNGYI